MKKVILILSLISTMMISNKLHAEMFYANGTDWICGCLVTWNVVAEFNEGGDLLWWCFTSSSDNCDYINTGTSYLYNPGSSGHDLSDWDVSLTNQAGAGVTLASVDFENNYWPIIYSVLFE